MPAQGNLPTGFLGGPDGNVMASLDGAVAKVDADAAEGDVSDDVTDTTADGAEVTPDDVDGGTPEPDLPEVTDPVDTTDVVDPSDVSETCTPGEPGCDGCSTDAHCLAEDDGNLCNGRSICVDGICVVDDDLPSCDDDTGDPCTVQACDPATGACVVRPAPVGTSCDDGDACTPNDRCEEGACVAGPRVTCDDGNPCTTDACEDGECEFTAEDGLPCDDGNACTTAETCDDGLCQGGPGAACGACEGDEDCEAYDDGDACNGVVTCEGGLCSIKLTSMVFCDAPDADSCGRDVCDPESGACVFTKSLNGTGCDDGDPCTVDDQCAAGNCIGNSLSCDEGACDTAECDPATGACAHTVVDDGTDCAGSQVCSDGATCQAGECVPSVEACPCAEDADCEAFDDGDACNGVVACVQGRCAVDPSTVVTCTPDGPCKTALCDPSSGECVPGELPDGTGCDDGDGCTQADNCVDGACLGEPLACEGDGPCSLAECHPFSGCVTTFVGGVCDNGDGCTELASCLVGQCNELTPIVCEASNLCVDAACDPAVGACVETPNTVECDDGDDCTLGDVCTQGACVGAPLYCDDGKDCTVDSCVGGVCEASDVPLEGALCDDGNLCTTGDRCVIGACVGVEEPGVGCDCESADDCEDLDDDDICTGTLDCVDGSCVVGEGTVVNDCVGVEVAPCMEAVCNKADGSCTMVALSDGTACVPGGLCEGEGTCQAGTCDFTNPACDDLNTCTIDSCDPAVGCVHNPTSGSCDDGNPCTNNDICSSGVCAGNQLSTCDCLTDADCAQPAHGDVCTGDLVCVGNACVIDPANVLECPDSGNPCTVTACDPSPSTGDPGCVVTVLDGSDCSDGDPCTVGDVCEQDVCVPGTAVVCDAEDTNPCVESGCNADTGLCDYTAVAGDCDDDNVCTTDETCQGSICLATTNECTCTVADDCADFLPNRCLGTAICGVLGCALQPGTEVVCDTSADTPCATTSCDPDTGDCVQTLLEEGAPCNADDACLVGAACTAEGLCEGEALDCDDANPCTVDSCDPASGCSNTPSGEGAPCDDGDACSFNCGPEFETCPTGDRCEEGVCVSGVNTCICFDDSGCDDQNVGIDQCAGLYICEGLPGVGACVKADPVSCNPTGFEPCFANVCDPATGGCTPTHAPAGTGCDDGDPCSVDDACVPGTNFCSGTPMLCDEDVNDCLDSTCVDGECIESAVPNFVGCVDDDWCTKPSVCFDGGCGIDKCPCETDAYCANEFNSDDLCAAVHICDEDTGRCIIDQSSAVSCYDDNPYDCIEYACDPLTGTCSATVGEDGSPCEDEHGSCTINDVCDSSGCVGTWIFTCDDPTPDDCVDYQCVPTTGLCGNVPRATGSGCSDGNECTVDDLCIAGACQGTQLTCEDDSSCTEDVCSATLGCIHPHLFGDCDDGDPCTEGTFCAEGTCKSSGTGITNSCGGCTVDNHCDQFDDGDPCTGTWFCDSGTCKVNPDTVPVCAFDAGLGDEACHEVSCNPSTGACETVELPASEGCDDGDPCTEYDRCDGGSCTGVTKACDDGDACTSDSCHGQTGGCINTVLNNGQPCDDGDACNGVDTCQEGACVGNGAGECGACTTDADCADVSTDLCAGAYLCNSGTCVLNRSSVVVCPPDPTGCTLNTCVPETGQCESAAVPDGTVCNDSQLCTADDRCTAGVCAGSPVDCTDDDDCTLDYCDADFGCIHDVFSGECDDGNPCTKNDICVDGSCLGVTDNCDDGNQCTNDFCLPGAGCRNSPQVDGFVCQDDDVCTITACNGGECVQTSTNNFCFCNENGESDCENIGDLCSGLYTCNSSSQKCELIPETKVVCPEGGECFDYTCNEIDGECTLSVHDGASCDDGTECTSDDTCVGDECIGTEVPQPTLDICQDAVCVPSEGWLFQHGSGACELGACSNDERCLEGQCAGVPVPSPSTGFDDGELSNWSITTSGQQATWQLTGVASTSPPFGLHAVNQASDTMADPGGAWLASATWMPVSVPFGAKSINIRFRVRADFETDGCEHQAFAVTVDGAQVDYLVRVEGVLFGEPAPCDGTGGDFLEGQVSLGQTYEGEDVEVGFTLETFSADGNGGAGVIIDDVSFEWNCVSN